VYFKTLKEPAVSWKTRWFFPGFFQVLWI
jgi:hypothetical protein